MIGLLYYLTSTSRPDISISTHQCDRFGKGSKVPRELAVRQISKYFLGTNDRGIIFKPNQSTDLEYFVDTGFAGG